MESLPPALLAMLAAASVYCLCFVTDCFINQKGNNNDLKTSVLAFGDIYILLLEVYHISVARTDGEKLIAHLESGIKIIDGLLLYITILGLPIKKKVEFLGQQILSCPM